MYSKVSQHSKSVYKLYALFVVSVGYVIAELGHHLISTTSKEIAKDLHFGDIACQQNSSEYDLADLPVLCEEANSSEYCGSLQLNGTKYCEWNYNGLGLDYQLLAGPGFIAVFSVAGLILGFIADRYSRVKMLALCTVIFSVAMILMGTVKEYWQLFLLRMVLAAGEAGCNPMASGLLTDWFTEEHRALVLSVFNWGIYGGFGIAFPVGRYVPNMNVWDLGWKMCYFGAGMVGLIFAFLTGFTLMEPKRTKIGEEVTKGDEKTSAWDVILQPRLICLCLAASIRNSGGICFSYNCDLYFREYFRDYDLGWWLFTVTIVIGSMGALTGGFLSDKFVTKLGIKSRVMVLALSQLIATPFAFGSVYFEPQWAIISLGISFFFAEMWIGIVIAILVEIVPLSMRSTTVGVAWFVMNNIGGNLPILMEPVRKLIGFRESLYIFYVGFYFLSSIMFMGTMFLMDGPKKKVKKITSEPGHDNSVSTLDDICLSAVVLPRLPHSAVITESTRL